MSWQHSLATREVTLAALGGVAAAAISHVLGRSARLALGVPMAGSLTSALPRTAVLLVVLACGRAFGVLTLAGVAEGVVSLGMGGLFPLCVAGPVLAGLCGDAAWALSRRVVPEMAALTLCGALLSSVRVAAALLLVAALGLPVGRGPGIPPGAVVAILGANVLLGLFAGLVGGLVARELRRAGVMA